MAIFALLVLVALVVVGPTFVAALVLWLAGRRADGAEAASLRSARRHELLIAVTAALSGTVVAAGSLSLPVVWTADFAPMPAVPGLLQTMTPFAVALVFCGARAAGELTWPGPSGVVRTAPLVRRTVWSLGGVRLRWLLVTAAATAAVLVVCGLTAGPTGRAFETQVVPLADGGSHSASGGPYPGWAYGIPLLAGLALTLVATLATLRLVARRPPLTGLALPDDAAVRATSAARVLGGAQACAGLALGAVLFFAGNALRGVSSAYVSGLGNADATFSWLGPAGAVVLFLGVAVAGASVVAGLLSVVPRRAGRPVLAGAMA